MPPQDQHGGCSHPTAHSCSTDPLTPSVTSLTNYMPSSVGVVARQQVLVSITLPPTIARQPATTEQADRWATGHDLRWNLAKAGWAATMMAGLWPETARAAAQ